MLCAFSRARYICQIMLALAQAGLGPRLPVAALRRLLALSPALTRTLRTDTAEAEIEEREHDRRYVDRLKLTAKAGKGGNGCASFYQGASRGRHAVADGGSGGDGGNVVLRAVANMKSLAGVQQLYKAEAGLHGTKQRQHGRAGRDTVVLVPVGTMVQRLRDEEEEGDGPAGKQRRQLAGAEGSSRGGRDGVWSAAAGAAARRQGEQAQETGEEEEVPEWVRRWRRPFSGADYDSSADEEADLNSPAAATADDAEAAGSGAGGSDVASWIHAGSSHAGGIGGHAGSGKQEGWQQESWHQRRQAEEQRYQLLEDLTEEGQEVVVAQGGGGGRGNAGIKARAHRPAPTDAERGQPGEVSRLLLELKMLADVGLVGLPNAGKSTLLRALTAATPRVGDYAFTTLAPQLGVVPAPAPAEEPIVIADIPGLIEGAHENRGLGHHFLRHIERTKAIAFVLDCRTGSSGGAPGPSPSQQLLLLQEELAAYSPHLASLPALIVANKLDVLRSPGRALEQLQDSTDLPILGVSAKEQATLLAQTPAQQAQQAQQHAQGCEQAAVGRGTQGKGQPAYRWAPGLRPLHFRLAQLLHQAGARQHPPHWPDFAKP